MKKHAEAHLAAIAMLRAKPRDGQFAQPLDFLLDEHMRQRALCGLLDEWATTGRLDGDAVAAASEFLKSDFCLHVLDEEEDLFPLLRKRLPADEHLEDVLDQLSAEHTRDREVAQAVTEGLQNASKGCAAQAFLDLLSTFAASERRHMIVENAIVIPLARASLTAQDLNRLGCNMAVRRGAKFPEPENVV
jgi:hemerythrin-like domain-containing protein